MQIYLLAMDGIMSSFFNDTNNISDPTALTAEQLGDLLASPTFDKFLSHSIIDNQEYDPQQIHRAALELLEILIQNKLCAQKQQQDALLFLKAFFNSRNSPNPSLQFGIISEKYNLNWIATVINHTENIVATTAYIKPSLRYQSI